ncbi:MAG: hypothetical protein GY754_12370, partial [bacterium]|nr:hypothetical protein [bacterium]
MNNNNLKNLKHILNKCELARPIPLVEQKHIKKSRRKIMKNVFLSASGKFGFFEGLVAWVFLGFTNFGVRLSVFQSAVVVVIASVAVVAVISSGSYFAVAFFSSESPAPA